MTHELNNVVAAFLRASENDKKCVLATLVDLEGSAYRRPGVRMLITEDGQMTGAISGGCIEKDVLLESISVFKFGQAKMMSYDGRYRLGCEGEIYILIEPFNPSSQFIDAFHQSLETRLPFSLTSYYTRELIADDAIGTVAHLDGKDFALNQQHDVDSFKEQERLVFNQTLPPMFRLIVFGGEYDAAKLSIQASLLGWQVILVTTPLDSYTTVNFPGSYRVLQATADQLPENLVDENSAVVMMTHNYAKDLSYLVAIKNYRPFYLGLLGPAKRRNKLLDDFLEHQGEMPEEILTVIHGPAGLNLGAETAEEIALSICSEIIAVERNRDAGKLNDLKGEMHPPISTVHGTA